MGPVPKKPQGQALEGENVTWGSEKGTQGPELLKPLEGVPAEAQVPLHLCSRARGEPGIQLLGFHLLSWL